MIWYQLKDKKEAAFLSSHDGIKAYNFLNEDVSYTEVQSNSELKSVTIYSNGTIYYWCCNDYTATYSNNNTQAKKWYTVSNQGEFQLYEGSCPINKNDYTAEQIKNEEYLDRVIASFSSDNS